MPCVPTASVRCIPKRECARDSAFVPMVYVGLSVVAPEH